MNLYIFQSLTPFELALLAALAVLDLGVGLALTIVLRGSRSGIGARRTQPDCQFLVESVDSLGLGLGLGLRLYLVM